MGMWPYDTLISGIFIPYFHKHGEDAIPFLVNGQISSRAFLSLYKNDPTIKPLDEMEDEAKRKLKKSVIALFPEKTPEQMVTACKIIYTIGVASQYVTQEGDV